MNFNVGDKVIYPYHGVVEVTEIGPRSVDGAEVTYVMFSVAARSTSDQRPMTVSVPAHRAAEVGVREAASVEDADELESGASRTTGRS